MPTIHLIFHRKPFLKTGLIIAICPHLLKDNSMPVELLSNAGGVLDLRWDGKAQSRKLSDLPK